MLKQDMVNLPIFEGLDPEALNWIEPMLDLCTFAKDDRIFNQGQPATFLYIVVSGEVNVRFKPYDGPELSVARILPGGVFGWSAALGHNAYTSSAVAVEFCEAARIHGDQLHRLCQERPEIGVVVLERLAGVIAERLRSTYSQILSILTKGMDLKHTSNRRIEPHERQ